MRIFRFVAVAGVLALFGAADIQAQTIGFKLGASFSTLSDDDLDESLKTLTAFTGGGFVRFGTGRISVQPELMYVTKGAKIEDGSDEADFKLKYIEVPVLLVFSLTQGTSASPYVLLGPAFAFESGCELSGSDGGVSVDIDCDEFGFDTKSIDVGAMGGLGVAIPAGPGSVLIEGRYNFGLININDGEGSSTKNRSGAVLLGYSIPLTR